MNDKQPIYAVTDYDCCPYITAGKAYRVVEYHGDDEYPAITVFDDSGSEKFMLVQKSASFRGQGRWHLIQSLQDEQQSDDQPITLRPGDYVLTSELRDEAHYREVGEAFMRAGAEKGEFPNFDECEDPGLPAFGWCSKDGLYHATDDGGFMSAGAPKRRLTPAQVIAAAPAKPETKCADPDPVDTALDRYRTAQRQAEERKAWDGYVVAAIVAIGDISRDHASSDSGGLLSSFSASPERRAAKTADALLELRSERFPD